MKNHWKNIFGIFGILCLVGVFFYKTIFNGLLPVPTDSLVGMYHPWRDAYAHTFQNGVPFKNFLITDPVRQQIPWRKQAIEALKSKKLPLWDATSFSGAPLLANVQSGAFYPFNILFFLFPFATAWAILIISQPLLAGIFLYLFLRHKQLDVLSSLVGAVCFAFSGFSVAWLTWGTIGSTIAWLPLILLSFEKIHEVSKKTPWRLVFILSVVSSFFAGHIQIFLYCMILFSAYAVWTYRKMKVHQIFLMHIVIPSIILAITAPVCLRLVAFLPDTSRIAGSTWTVEGFFIPIRHLIQFIAPDYFGNPATLNYWGTWNYGEMIGYIGVIGILLALVGVARSTVFWIGVLIVSLLFAVDSPLSRLPYVLGIPGLSSLQPTRLLSLVDFSLSILAAYGMASVIQGRKMKQMMVAGIVVLLVVVGMWVSVRMPTVVGIPSEFLDVVKRNIILPTLLFGGCFFVMLAIVIAKKSWDIVRYCGAGVFLLVLVFELVRFGWKFTPFTPSTYFFPKTEVISELIQFKKPFRVLATDDRLLPPNTLSFYDIESISGYDPIHSFRYEEYMAAMERGEPNITPPFGFGRIITPKTITSPLLSLLDVQYVLSMEPLVDSRVRLLREEGTTKLYKYVGSAPRVYLAEDIRTETSKEGVIRVLYDPSFIPGRTAVVESPIFVVTAPLLESEAATITSYGGDRMTIETLSKNTRLLVIGNIMDSHWQVLVDNKKTPLYRVNYLFFGVIVPSGAHTIQVQYR